MRKNIWEIPFVSYILQQVQHYNHAKYWKRRAVVIDASNGTSLLKKLYYLLWIKRIDAYHNASCGTNLNTGAKFSTPPHFATWT